MIKLAATRLAIGAPLVAAALVGMWVMTATVRAAPAPVAAFAPSCTFTIDDPIPIGPELATVTTTFTDRMGDTLTAEFPADSKIEVVSIRRGKADGPLTATLVVSAIHAVAGQWNVSVRGEKGECTGKVWVGQGVTAKKVTVPVVTGSAPAALSSHDPAKSTGARRGACAVFIEDSIRVGRDRVEVLAKYTEEIGPTITASFPAASKLEVISAKHRAGDEAVSIRLTLNTLNAVPGQWNLTLQGDTENCTGNVYVGATPRKQR